MNYYSISNITSNENSNREITVYYKKSLLRKLLFLPRKKETFEMWRGRWFIKGTRRLVSKDKLTYILRELSNLLENKNKLDYFNESI